MTRKLYYENAKLQSFTAEVVAQIETERGPAVQLDQTAFYPTSGGQQHDTGHLNNVPVLDVGLDEEGEVWHLLAHPLSASAVEGRIEWSRRFDLMQQHTGQHLLSAAFARELQAGTLAVHMGASENTVDLDIAELTWETAFEIEDAINQIITENRDVEARFVDDEELARLSLRREPKVPGPIRVVSIAGFDATPCGGTHTELTGEVGLVKISRIERYKGGVRVTFLCGRRALLDYRRRLQLLQTLGLELSVGQPELLETVTRLQQDLRDTRRAYASTRTALNELEAERLWQNAATTGAIKYLTAHRTDGTFDDIQIMAQRLQRYPDTVALLAVTEPGGVRLICVRSDTLPQIDAATILRAATAALGGRGGGSPSLARGGAPAASPELVQQVLQQEIKVALS
ncbi:MAG: alanyl-tRNA editing protein [Anaerolineae bacterium]|nr:alanyl-tRNA editing protein [Anaerolineae bacterium]